MSGMTFKPKMGPLWPWLVAGAALILLTWIMVRVGGWFEQDRMWRIFGLTMAYGLAGAVLLGVVWRVARYESRVARRSVLGWIIGAGLVMRLLCLMVEPQYETDYYRYLWDGAMVAQGYDPYAVPPGEFLWGEAAGPTGLPAGDPELEALVAEGRPVLERINHPHLTTIYPPVAQGIFAAAYWISPWSTVSLRVLFLVFDAAVLVMLFMLLRRLRMPPALVVIWWWNPIVVKEFYISAHMDGIVAALVMAAVTASGYGRGRLALVLLGLSLGAKLWPVVLAPVLLRRYARSWKQLMLGMSLFAVSGGIVLWPLLLTWGQEDSGLGAHSQYWVNNAGFFAALHWTMERLGQVLELHWQTVLWLSRIAAGGLLAGWIAYVSWRPVEDDRDLLWRCMAVAAVMFLVIPTQFPWYYTWVIPLLAVARWGVLWPVLLYTMLLPLYHLHYDYPRVVWLQHLPVWGLIGWMILRRSAGIADGKPLKTSNRRGAEGEHQEEELRLVSATSAISAVNPRPRSRSPAGNGCVAQASRPCGTTQHGRDARATSHVDVIIPALNEAEAIGRVIAAIPKWVRRVVVADNGSTDRTAEAAAAQGAVVVHEPMRGYGAACLAGLAELEKDQPDVVVFLDGDFSDHPDEMNVLVQPILDGAADLVIGSRVLGDAQAGALTLPQRFGNALACRLIRWLHGVRYTDLGPFRAIRFDALRSLAMDDRGYGWTVQMQVRAARLGLRSAEAPVSYRRRIGRSKISGTVRGVVSAGCKILYTIFHEGLDKKPRQAAPPPAPAPRTPAPASAPPRPRRGC